jgi:hypothetical protein
LAKIVIGYFRIIEEFRTTFRKRQSSREVATKASMMTLVDSVGAGDPPAAFFVPTASWRNGRCGAVFRRLLHGGSAALSARAVSRERRLKGA